MNFCNKFITSFPICTWINPSWVNDRLYQNGGDHAVQYAALGKAIEEKESFENLIKLLNGFTFFPNQLDEKIYIIGLLYLTKFENNVNISPFTAAQEKIIRISNQTDKTACCWLNIGGILSCVLAGVSGCVPAFWNSIPACLSASSGCLATGKYPDLSSNAANTHQNSYHLEIQVMYQNIAQELISMMGYDPALAIQIASHLDINNIGDAIKANLGDMEANALVKLMRESKDFVLHNQTPHSDANLRNAAKVVILEDRVEILEKVISDLMTKLDMPPIKSKRRLSLGKMFEDQSYPIKNQMIDI